MAGTNQQSGIFVLRLLIKSGKIHIAEDIDIMNKNGNFCSKKGLRFLNAATRFEKPVSLITHMDIKSKILIGCKITDDLISEMMHVDNNSFETGILEFRHYMPEQRLSPHPYQRFRHRIGKWLQASA